MQIKTHYRSGSLYSLPRLVLGLRLFASAALLLAPAWALGAESGDSPALMRIANPPLGLPAVPIPADNRPTTEKIELGRKLFFDPRLSHDGTLSCGLCHLPEHGFTVNSAPLAIGKGGAPLRRNAPTVLNVAYETTLFRDGRRASLEQQALDPFLSTVEMANPSAEAVVEKIEALADYEGLFQRAFGSGPNPERIAMAIASYERTLLAGDSPFDRWHFGGDESAVSEQVKRGFDLFKGKANCSLCHALGEAKTQTLFTDHRFRDAGVGWMRSRKADLMRFAGPAPINVLQGVAPSALQPPHRDYGRFEVTGDPPDLFLYRTPSLRNVALTAPYMHDGSMATLRDVVAYYNIGGFRAYGIDPMIHALNLTTDQQHELVAFMESLTSTGLAELIAEARVETVFSE